MLRPALVLFTVFTLLLGIGYPLVVTGICAVLFPSQAGGSLVVVDDQVVGSALLAQPTAGDEWFWPRPSATGYSATDSGGSNLGPNNPALVDATSASIAALDVQGPVPVDLVTASGSGLDPHISPEAARLQVPRVAAARGRSEASVQALVDAHTEAPTLGVLGADRVNVLELNLDLMR